MAGTKKYSPRFNGPEYKPQRDHSRLSTQNEKIKWLMRDNRWRTLAEISEQTGFPEASISAQLRHLRKPRFGAYIVSRRQRSVGLYEYQLLSPHQDRQMRMI